MSLPGRRRGAETRSETHARSGTDYGIDVVGDIAVLRFEDAPASVKKETALKTLEETKSVKAVFEQVGGIEGEFRLRALSHLAGEDRTLTVHKENGCLFEVDIATCYFSPRLSTERLRVAEEVSPGESVLNMFAGVGPFSIVIAKKKKARVTSVELNPVACEFHRKNNVRNKVSDLVQVLNVDASHFETEGLFDRVLMPHPTQSMSFLDAALAKTARGGTVYCYRHASGVELEEAREEVAGELARIGPEFSVKRIRRVREVGPRWLELVAEIVRA
jgi:tRNA (guanine37-N1)-methyltransferase